MCKLYLGYNVLVLLGKLSRRSLRLSLPHIFYLLAISWIYCCLCYFSCNLGNVVNCDSVNQYSKQQTCKEKFRCKKKWNKWDGKWWFHICPSFFFIDLNRVYYWGWEYRNILKCLIKIILLQKFTFSVNTIIAEAEILCCYQTSFQYLLNLYRAFLFTCLLNYLLFQQSLTENEF